MSKLHVTDEWLASLAATMRMRLTRSQGDAIRAIAFECERQDVTDSRQITYILATAYHECRFKTIREIRAKVGTEVWKMQERYWHTGFYGRGLCQLTWRKNYQKFSVVVGADLVKEPDLLLNTAISAKVLVYGMANGSFTALGLSSKNKLSAYFSEDKTDWIGARKIVNGTFQADFVQRAALRILPLVESGLK